MNQGENLCVSKSNREQQQQSQNCGINYSVMPRNPTFKENRHRRVTNNHPCKHQSCLEEEKKQKQSGAQYQAVCIAIPLIVHWIRTQCLEILAFQILLSFIL